MIKHEVKNCPRCDAEFECKSGSISLCQCQSIELHSRQAEYVAARYEGCLCAACLAELRSECNVGMHESRLQALLAER